MFHNSFDTGELFMKSQREVKSAWGHKLKKHPCLPLMPRLRSIRGILAEHPDESYGRTSQLWMTICWSAMMSGEVSFVSAMVLVLSYSP